MTSRFARLTLLSVSLLAVPFGLETPAAGQAAKKAFQLTVDSIMRGTDLVGYAPTGLRWSGDSRELYFEWRKPGEDEAATYAVPRQGGEPRRLSDEERKSVPPARGEWDEEHRRVLFVDQGDIVVVDSVSRSRQTLVRTAASESNPRWARKETAVTFMRDNVLYLMPLAGGTLEQVLDVQPPRREPRETDSQKFLRAEEQKLIEFTKKAAERRKKEEEKREKERLPVFEIRERQAVSDLQLSPDGRYVFVLVTERPDGAKTAEVPNYVTESAYTENIQARTKVGDAQGRRRLAVFDLEGRKTVWADSSFAGKRTITDPSAPDKKREMEREVRWGMPMLSEDGSLAVVAVRSEDNEDRWIVAVEPATGKTRVIDHLHDDAWVLEDRGMGWMPDGRSVYFVAEHDGWLHLYVVDASKAGAARQQLTSGRFEVGSVTLSADKTRFYFTSSERHPGERHLYSMPITGGPRTQITTRTGSNIAEVSPDDTTIAVVHSYSNKPPELYLGPNRPGSQLTQVTTTPTEEWRSFKWADPEVLTFKARDGVDVYARLYTPEMMGARRDPLRPGVVFVHGAGYAQNAHKYWASYFREYMFHNLLAARGYVVLDVDYRASSGYGRDWRTAIYRHMGGKDLDDIVDGARYLVEHQKVDPKRIGVYGGSYGGFITLMAMFTSPETFAAGAALRPVTDWAHYNHGYTANILNEPQEDAEAYRRSSPIYFAEGLKGALLICHGLVDTNVHIQDSIRLVQRLIELRKDNWELAVYPVENHGFEQETSWADEYKRILRLFETNLRSKPARTVS
ncbi:MAG: alpha/beta fold hydrolase [Vicinamibacterales bacterium]